MVDGRFSWRCGSRAFESGRRKRRSVGREHAIVSWLAKSTDAVASTIVSAKDGNTANTSYRLACCSEWDCTWS